MNGIRFSAVSVYNLEIDNPDGSRSEWLAQSTMLFQKLILLRRLPSKVSEKIYINYPRGWEVIVTWLRSKI